MAMVKKRVGTFFPESPEEQYAQILIPYALDSAAKPEAYLQQDQLNS